MTEPIHDGVNALSFSYEATPDGGSKVVIATIEHGELLAIQLGPAETIDNLLAWASVAGLVVTRPL